jgi:hypothetical protein
MHPMVLAKRMVMSFQSSILKLIQKQQHLCLQVFIPLDQQLIVTGQTSILIILQLQLIYPLSQHILTTISRFLLSRLGQSPSVAIFDILEEELDLSDW